MSELTESLERALQDVIAMQNSELPLTKRENMPAPTYYVSDRDEKLIYKLTEIRKKENISQTELANMLGVKQQSISRTEKNEHSPSLKLFCEMAYALGYNLELVKQ